MTTVSPVFHSEATVSIGLKNVLRVGTSIILPTLNKINQYQLYKLITLLETLSIKGMDILGLDWML